MVEIRNREELERWLEGRLAEHTLPIANRALLRAIPALETQILVTQLYHNWKNRFILPMLRSSIASLAKSKNAKIWILLVENLYSEDFLKNSHALLPEYHLSLRGLLKSFIDLSNSSSFNPTFRRVNVSLFYLLISIGHDEFELEWDSLNYISLDATALESGVNLWSQPLWLDDTPEWAIRGWETLATELTRRAPHWKTLVRWYEDRLHGDDWAASQGRPAIPELEIARASLPDSYWKKGGKAVNEAIAKLEDFYWNGVPIDDPVLKGLVEKTADTVGDVIEAQEVAAHLPEPNARSDAGPFVEAADIKIVEADLPLAPPLPPLDALPAQNPTAIQFNAPIDGPIGLAPPADDEQLMLDAGRIEDYAEIRLKAADLSAEGTNRLGRLGVPIERFLELTPDLGSVRAKLLWSRINTIRRVLDGHRDAKETIAAGGERDERLLDGVIADKLTDLVETANQFMFGDPVLMELDARRSGPQELAVAKAEVGLAAPFVELAASDRRITDAAAGAVIAEQIDNVLSADDTLAGRQAADLGAKTTRNYVGSLIRVWRVLRRVASSAAKGVVEGIYRDLGRRLLEFGISDSEHVVTTTAHFIANHADALVIYVRQAFGNGVEAIIRAIEGLVGGM